MGNKSEKLKYLFEDHPYGDDRKRPFSLCKIIEGGHGRLFSTCLMAGGSGMHPTVVFCHGYPEWEDTIVRTIEELLIEKEELTSDLGGKASTSECGDAFVQKLRN